VDAGPVGQAQRERPQHRDLEETRQPVTTEHFDELIAAMDSAMVVVTVAAGDERDGCLVGFHGQCSIEPRRYAVWLSVANRTYELAEQAPHLAVHLLGADDSDLAELFGGQTGDDVDKLALCGWEPGPGGVPLLARCPARFVGRIVERGSGFGDHDLFVLAVADGSAGEVPAAPLRLSAVTGIDPGHEATERR
jgi:flavin reductase (DIM6/NTAB) family NADH-FMN oxidoreductase RutF